MMTKNKNVLKKRSSSSADQNKMRLTEYPRKEEALHWVDQV